MNIEIIKEFFMWNVVINLVFFIWTAIMCMAARGCIVRVHGKLFGLSENAINSILYGFLGAYKIVFIVFALVPWIVLCIMS